MFTIIYDNKGNVINIVAGESNYEHLLENSNEFIYVDKLPKYDLYRQSLRVVDKQLKVIDLEISPEREKTIRYMEISQRISELKQKLASTDYQAIKFAEDELSAEEYEPTKLERRAWREEINELETNFIEQ